MQDGVVVETLGDTLRLRRHVLLRFGAHFPAVLPARRLIGREAAAMGQHDLQLRMTVHDAAENKTGGGDGGVERVAYQIAEIIRLQPVGARDVVGMDEHEGAELFGRRPQRLEARIVQVLAQDVGGEHRALEAELGHGALELIGGAFGILHRQRGYAQEARGMGGDVLGHLVVLNPRQHGAERRLLGVKISLRRGRKHVHVDAGRIHVLEPARDIEAAGRERPVHHAGDIECRIVGIVGRDRDLDARLGQHRGGFQGADVGVGVDRAHFAHFVL